MDLVELEEYDTRNFRVTVEFCFGFDLFFFFFFFFWRLDTITARSYGFAPPLRTWKKAVRGSLIAPVRTP